MTAASHSRTGTLVMVPTYNEADNVGALADRILKSVPEARLLFVDDNSPDGTGQILDDMAAAEPRISVMHRESKEGIGAAHVAGIDYAYANNFAVLVTMDGDLTHVPEHIPRLITTLEDNDVVAGSRFHPEGGLEDWTPLRRALAHSGHLMTRILLGLNHDATGAFRAYDLRTVPQDAFHLVKSKGYSFFFESLKILQVNGCRIDDIPVVLPARAYGHSKMRLSDALMSVRMLFRVALRTRLRPSTCRAKVHQ